jgi:hypothetical protein
MPIRDSDLLDSLEHALRVLQQIVLECIEKCCNLTGSCIERVIAAAEREANDLVF